MTPDWYDGPKLAQWLQETGYLADLDKKGQLARSVSRWRCGHAASERTVDHLMVAVGGHISEIPEELGIAAPYRGKTMSHAEAHRLRDRGEELIREGMDTGEIAAELNVNRRTVNKWRQRLWEGVT